MPTRRGWAAFAAAVPLYVGGWWSGYVELSVLATGCVAALVAAWLLRYGNRAVRVSRDVAPARVARGDPALAVLRVVNASRRRTAPATAADRCGDQSLAVDLPAIASGSAATASYVLPTGRRGRYRLGPIRITTTDPLGLFRTVHVSPHPTELTVLPRTVPTSPPAGERSAELDGARPGRAQGTATLYALREYVVGDDLRHVHWRTSAHTGTLMVREMVDLTMPRTTILLDIRAGSYAMADPSTVGDGFELAVDVCASIATAWLRRRRPVSVLTTAGPMFDGQGRTGDADAVLDRLALVGLDTSETGTSESGVSPQRPGVWALSARGRPGAGRGALIVVTGTGVADLAGWMGTGRAFDRTLVLRTGRADPRTPEVAGASTTGTHGAPVLAVPDLAALAALMRPDLAR